MNRIQKSPIEMNNKSYCMAILIIQVTAPFYQETITNERVTSCILTFFIHLGKF